MPGPLDGIRILDFTRYQQGPMATVMLSDMGADVIKVEEPEHGDNGRSIGLEPDGWCAYFEAYNRNKRSVTLDLRRAESKEIVRKLVLEADVVTDNFRPGQMRKLGLDYEALSAINPRIITASACGYGPEGPLKGEPSFDIVGQGMGGIMSLQGGGPELPPQHVPLGIADQVGAFVFATAVCAALVARERQGIGQHVDVSLLGSQIALQGWPIQMFLRSGVQVASTQRRGPIFTYYGCSDGLYLTIGILDPKWWPNLCRVLDRPELATDERFATPRGRADYADALRCTLDEAFLERPRAEWLRRLREEGVPSGPVNDYAALVQDPQVLANGYIDSFEQSPFGPLRVVGSPIRMSRTPVKPQHPAPALGEHTDEVLARLGYTPEQIIDLRAALVI